MTVGEGERGCESGNFPVGDKALGGGVSSAIPLAVSCRNCCGTTSSMEIYSMGTHRVTASLASVDRQCLHCSY